MRRAGGVWWATARPVDGAPLDDATRARLAALHRPADRDRHATAARLGDLLVRLHAGEGARVHRPRGAAPRVTGADPPLFLSVSHAGAHVVVAAGPHPLGVDVEEATADIAGAAAALAPSEERALAALPLGERPAALLRLWVRKEAVLKAAGVGLAVDPRRLVLGETRSGPVIVAAPPLPTAGPITVHDLDGPAGTVSAVAFIGGGAVGRAGIAEHDGDALLAAGS